MFSLPTQSYKGNIQLLGQECCNNDGFSLLTRPNKVKISCWDRIVVMCVRFTRPPAPSEYSAVETLAFANPHPAQERCNNDVVSHLYKVNNQLSEQECF